jgi:hypothetical protein
MAVYVADGTTIARGNAASPEVFTSIPQVSSIGTIGQDRGLIDITNLSSAAREYKKAIKDGQEIQLSCQWNPDDATHDSLRTDVDSEDSVNFRVTFTDSPPAVVNFAAQVTNASVSNIEIDNVLMLNVTLKPTGDLTWT